MNHIYKYALVLAVAILATGCSGGSSAKKSVKAKGNQNGVVETADLVMFDAELSVDENSDLVLTLIDDEQDVATLKGSVGANSSQANALKDGDGTFLADVKSELGKSIIYTVVHTKGSETSQMFMFSQNRGEYRKISGPTSIEKAGALDAIDAAILAGMNDGKSRIQSIYEMQGQLSKNPNMTFAQYQSRSEGDYTISVETPEESFGETEVESDIQEQVVVEKKETVTTQPTVSPIIEQRSQGEARPKKNPRVVTFPPAIKPSIVHKTPRPQHRPSVTHSRRHHKVDIIESLLSTASGKSVAFYCARDASEISVQGESIDFKGMMGCINQSQLESGNRIAIKMSFLDYVDGANDIRFLLDIDYDAERFVQNTFFRWKFDSLFNHETQWDYSPTTIVGSGDDIRVKKSMTIDAPYRDSVEINLNCRMVRTARQCAK